MAAQQYGYIRVSPRDQNEDRQRIAMREFAFLNGTSSWTNSPARISSVRGTRG